MVQLKGQCIISELKSSSKEAVLRELAGVVHDQCTLIDLDTLCQVLTEREQLGSTGVGSGVAIPHGKVPGLKKLLLCFGRSRSGVSFDAVDNRPVHLFVMILSPPGIAGEYLQILARVSRLLKDPTVRNRLLQATDTETILELFNRTESHQQKGASGQVKG
jgi:PTS system nitrogen regulatory IIA component